MNLKNLGKAAAVLTLFFHCVVPASLWAGAVTEQMRETVEKVVAIVQDPGLRVAGAQGERLDRLRQVLGKRFDFAEMAKRSLGATWNQRRPDEQREFARLFTGMLEKAYADQIAAFNGEKVIFGRERQEQNFAELETTILTTKQERLPVHYKLVSANGEWRVYDVVFADVSLVNNYRSQFSRLLAKSSFEELLAQMRKAQEVR